MVQVGHPGNEIGTRLWGSLPEPHQCSWAGTKPITMRWLWKILVWLPDMFQGKLKLFPLYRNPCCVVEMHPNGGEVPELGTGVGSAAPACPTPHEQWQLCCSLRNRAGKVQSHVCHLQQGAGRKLFQRLERGDTWWNTVLGMEFTSFFFFFEKIHASKKGSEILIDA